MYQELDRQLKDYEFEIEKLLELIKLNREEGMTGESGALMLYLCDRFHVDLDVYMDAMEAENFRVEEAKRRVQDVEQASVMDFLDKMQQDFNASV